MPRHVNIVPKDRKKTVGGNCYAVVDICGHVHHLGRYNSKASHIEYDRLIAEWLAAGRPSTEAQLNQDIQTTVIELIAAYFKHVQAYYGKSSEQTHRSRRILKLLRQYYGDIPADDFGPNGSRQFVRCSWREATADDTSMKTLIVSNGCSSGL